MANPTLAAILSLVWPGLGQIYNRKILTGIALCIFSVIMVALWWTLIVIPFYIGMLAFAVYDAYKTAKIGRDEMSI